MEPERFERLHGRCCHILRDMCQRSGMPIEDIEDIEQEMALILLQLDGQGDGYCLLRATGAAVDWVRRTYRTRLTEKPRTDAEVAALVDSPACRRAWC